MLFQIGETPRSTFAMVSRVFIEAVTHTRETLRFLFITKGAFYTGFILKHLFAHANMRVTVRFSSSVFSRMLPIGMFHFRWVTGYASPVRIHVYVSGVSYKNVYLSLDAVVESSREFKFNKHGTSAVVIICFIILVCFRTHTIPLIGMLLQK